MKLHLLLIAFLLVVQPLALHADDTVTIQVKETRFRSAPQAWAPGIATLKYGDTLKALSSQDSWIEGELKSKKKGYVPVTAVTTKQIVLSDSRASVSQVDQTDVILAGKGFSQATESEYARQHGGANFRAVDSVEAIKVSDAELVQFMREGHIGNAK